MNQNLREVEPLRGLPPQASFMSGAEAILMALLAEGVDTVFGYPGGAIMPLYDALHGVKRQLRHVLVRHEQGAVHAAQGYARAGGGVGVCIATSGPGATNLVTGMVDAQADSTPIVCITGQVPSQFLGTDAFQETDVTTLCQSVTKDSILVTDGDGIAAALARAFYVARSGRPGPVLVDITKDAQLQQVAFSYRPCKGLRSYRPVPSPNEVALARAAALINKAERPMIVAGQGVVLARAEKSLRAVAERCGIPVARTLLGLASFPTSHELNVGMVGMHGAYGANRNTNACDVLVAVGMRFDDRVTGDLSRYAKQAKVIHLEIDPAEVDKNVKAEVAVLGDAKESLDLLLPRLKAKQHPRWLASFRACDLAEEERVIGPELCPGSGPLRMGEVVNALGAMAPTNTVWVSDVGQHQMATARYARFDGRSACITSGGLGTMGFALPAALGAKLASPEREVVAVIGDGGFQMTIQELGTLMQFQVPVKLLVLNNSYLGMVRQWQELFFDARYAETAMANPDFVALAKAYRLEAWRLTERDELRSSLQRFLDYPGPCMLEVAVAKEANVFPMIPPGASVSEVRLEV
jgi:acetolactate synthase I/II/III large subunit